MPEYEKQSSEIISLSPPLAFRPHPRINPTHSRKKWMHTHTYRTTKTIMIHNNTTEAQKKKRNMYGDDIVRWADGMPHKLHMGMNT